jgi:hypothetical protein
VAIRIEHGEVVGRGPSPQELLALLLETLQRADKRIGLDCKSLVDYVNAHHALIHDILFSLPRYAVL